MICDHHATHKHPKRDRLAPGWTWSRSSFGNHHSAGDPSRHLPHRRRPRDREIHLPRRLERTRPPVHLDQERRRPLRPRRTVDQPHKDVQLATRARIVHSQKRQLPTALSRTDAVQGRRHRQRRSDRSQPRSRRCPHASSTAGTGAPAGSSPDAALRAETDKLTTEREISCQAAKCSAGGTTW